MCVVNKGRSQRLLRKYLLRKEKEVKAAEAARDKEDRESIPSFIKEIDDLKNELMQRDAEIDSFEANRFIPYSTLSSPPPKRPSLCQTRRGGG